LIQQYLLLADNKLEQLPATTDRLLALEKLDLNRNRITQLPSSFALPRLITLSATNNILTELPDSLKRCTMLECLNLEGNPVSASFWSLAAQLPNLRELTPLPKRGDCTGEIPV
jgi:Leucine-rich repeat (LRR) protein